MTEDHVFAACFEASTSAQCVLSADGKGLVANGAARRLMGLTKVLPLPDFTTFDQSAGGLRRAMRLARETSAKTPVWLRNAQDRALEATVSPLGAEGDLFHLELSPARTAVAEWSKACIDDSDGTCEMRRVTAMVAHDLRTPLGQTSAAMQLYRSSLVDTQGAGAADTGLFWLDVAEGAVSRMSALVDELLDRARSESWGLVREELELSDVFLEATADFRRELEEIGARIRCDDLPTLNADRMLLRQLFSNLLSNAIKYRAAGRRLEIDVSASSSAAGTEITMRDNGTGFPADETERLFGAFERGDGMGATDGVGYGLAACRVVAERHGWQLRATGEPGRGAAFTITVPAADRPPVAALG